MTVAMGALTDSTAAAARLSWHVAVATAGAHEPTAATHEVMAGAHELTAVSHESTVGAPSPRQRPTRS
ncbi:MAG TPA: hypothetical protein VF756_21200 [Thermoanaerobaculia bacterium]